MAETDPTIQQLIDQGFTHLQLLCCAAKLKPLDAVPERLRRRTFSQCAANFACAAFSKRATPARIAPWRHGMKRL
jgi:hypothetical protein